MQGTKLVDILGVNVLLTFTKCLNSTKYVYILAILCTLNLCSSLLNGSYV